MRKKKEEPVGLSLPAALEEWHETEQSTIIDAFVYLTRDFFSQNLYMSKIFSIFAAQI